jgi:hypothetical protein
MFEMINKGLVINILIPITIIGLSYCTVQTKAGREIARASFQAFGCAVEFALHVLEKFVCYLIDNRESNDCVRGYGFFCTDLVLMWGKILQWDFT